MATIDDFPRTRGETRCSYHPDVVTGLRCSRCGKPICPRCGVRTPVGMRCPECAGVRGLPTYEIGAAVLAKAAAAGFVVAAVIGVVWGRWPSWEFYLSLALGFGVAEAMAWASNAKRGRDLQAVALLMILFGLVLSRAIMAHRLGLTWADINSLQPPVTDWLQLRFIPDLLFAAVALFIGWIRFR